MLTACKQFRFQNVMINEYSIFCTGAELLCEEEQVLKSEASASSSGMNFGKQKPKRKWGLLVGGGRTKSNSNAKSSKSNTLTKETISDRDVARNRWSRGLTRVPLLATISKETMVCSARVLLFL
jgi:hypothetical protein